MASIIEIGIPGLRGPAGPPGPEGPDGPPGPANTLSVGTVTTGSAGSTASVVITGTAPNQTVSFTIPKGDKGDQGPAGAGAPAATSSALGSIQLAGDLGGTATAPTVPGLSGKANTSHTHGVTDLTATGTKSSSTVLHGDNVWRTVAAPTTDHGALTGLADDDHTQYHNDTRGDARYNTKSEITTFLAGKQNTGNYIVEGDSRLTNARTPTPHVHASTDISDATSAATPSTVVLRDSAGAAQLQNLTILGVSEQPTDAANKGYVDNGLATKVSSAQTITAVWHDGTTGGGVRPSGFLYVIWRNPPGTTYGRPQNMLSGVDEWEFDA